MTRDELRAAYAVFDAKSGGIEQLLWGASGDFVCDHIVSIEKQPLSKVQLNQILGFKEERAVSDDFFKFYWFDDDFRLPYKLSSVPGYSTSYRHDAHQDIRSVEQFFFGLYRIFIDGLLYFGNVRKFYREYCTKSISEIESLIQGGMFDTGLIKQRGPSLPLNKIPKDSRYLISEMACKSYGDAPMTAGELRSALLKAWQEHADSGGGAVTIRGLLSGKREESQQQKMFVFSAEDILESSVSSEEEVTRAYTHVATAFTSARDAALQNTKLYLSLVNDLDVYVATSMRTRSDFRIMADQCAEIFDDERVRDLHLRYFDPTLSAADGHQDKGLIECLMVKCAKVLVYCAGEKESYGKDAEAAMALSLGKPVIFLCPEQTRLDFYKDIHPLSRLINFSTGVAVGAIVTSNPKQVSELLDRIFENEMEYNLIQREGRPGYLQLQEKLTESIVRIQTNDSLLSEAFWNYYKSNP